MSQTIGTFTNYLLETARTVFQYIRVVKPVYKMVKFDFVGPESTLLMLETKFVHCFFSETTNFKGKIFLLICCIISLNMHVYCSDTVGIKSIQWD